jgi:hypothetical protein
MNIDFFSIASAEEPSSEIHHKTYKPGRRCVICKMPLSIYNSTNKCFCHPSAGPPRTFHKRGRWSHSYAANSSCNWPGCHNRTTGIYCQRHYDRIKSRLRGGWPLRLTYAPPTSPASRRSSLLELRTAESFGQLEEKTWYRQALRDIKNGVLRNIEKIKKK